MHVSVFEYRLRDVDEGDWAAACAGLAPAFARVPGLASKVWLKGGDGDFGGVYVWDSEERYRDFLTSDLGAAVAAHPNIEGLTMRDWGVDDVPTAITLGVLRP